MEKSRSCSGRTLKTGVCVCGSRLFSALLGSREEPGLFTLGQCARAVTWGLGAGGRPDLPSNPGAGARRPRPVTVTRGLSAFCGKQLQRAGTRQR